MGQEHYPNLEMDMGRYVRSKETCKLVGASVQLHMVRANIVTDDLAGHYHGHLPSQDHGCSCGHGCVLWQLCHRAWLGSMPCLNKTCNFCGSYGHFESKTDASQNQAAVYDVWLAGRNIQYNQQKDVDDFDTAIYTITTSDRVHKHDNDMQCRLRIIM